MVKSERNTLWKQKKYLVRAEKKTCDELMKQPGKKWGKDLVRTEKRVWLKKKTEERTLSEQRKRPDFKKEKEEKTLWDFWILLGGKNLKCSVWCYKKSLRMQEIDTEQEAEQHEIGIKRLLNTDYFSMEILIILK